MKQHNPNTELPPIETDDRYSIDVLVKLKDNIWYSGFYDYWFEEWIIYNFTPRDTKYLEDRSVVIIWEYLPKETDTGTL